MAPSVFKVQFPLTQGSIKQNRLSLTKLRSIHVMTYLPKKKIKFPGNPDALV